MIGTMEATKCFENCPNCGKKLELQQINFKTAILMCLNVNCPYPSNGQCVIVNRSIENMKKKIDISEQLKKQHKLQYEQHSESSLMLDLEKLLESHVHTNAKETTIKNADIENLTSNVQSVELPDLDEFLIDLLR